MYSVIIPIVLIVVAFIAIIAWRATAFRKLSERGVTVRGKVDKRIRTGMSNTGRTQSKRLAFTYQGPDGRSYRRSATVSHEKWEQYDVGDDIDIICLPDKPGTSAPAWLVELARDALKKR